MTYLPNTTTETVAPQALNQAAKEKLRQFVARVERLEEEKAEITGHIKEVFAEVKSLGFDTKALRSVIRLRKINAREREEQEMILDLYMQAIGEI